METEDFETNFNTNKKDYLIVIVIYFITIATTFIAIS
jgi:hypothetical protein